MINAYRRGYQEGAKVAQEHSGKCGSALCQVAHDTFTLLLEKGYAHLEPQEEFISGFIEGYEAQAVLAIA